MIRVSFCCNDDRGNFSGRVSEIIFGDRDLVIEGGPVLMRRDGEMVKVNRIWIAGSEWTTWHGNIFWDSCLITVTAAKRLAKWLLARGWKVTERADGAVVP